MTGALNSKTIIAVILTYVLAVVIGPLVATAPVGAISEKQRALFDNNVLYFDLETGACGEAEGRLLAGKNNEEKVWNYFLSKGLKPIAISGIMGNMKQESGFNPQIVQGGGTSKNPSSAGGGGWGLIQWTPGGKIIGIAREAKVKGKIYELSTQLDIVWWHMTTPGKTPTGATFNMNHFKNIKNSDEAVRYFEEKVEGAGVPMLTERYKFAKEALQKYGSGSKASPVDADSDDNGAGGCGDSGDGLVVDGYAFPIWAKKKSDYYIQGASKLPCSGICHHDGTPALDMSSKFKNSGTYGSEGAPVYAISDGKLTRVNYNNRRPSGAICNSITFTSSKDKHIYWYGHLKRDTSIPNGKTVKAGEKIGNVGNTRCADNTLPHLHISRVPPGASADSMGSRDAGLIKIVNKLYEKLP